MSRAEFPQDELSRAMFWRLRTILRQLPGALADVPDHRVEDPLELLLAVVWPDDNQLQVSLAAIREKTAA